MSGCLLAELGGTRRAVKIVNDVEALGWAVPHLVGSDIAVIGGLVIRRDPAFVGLAALARRDRALR